MAVTSKVATVSVQRIRVDKSTLAVSEEDVMKQILATHARNGAHVDVKPVFNVADNILGRATLIVDSIAAGTQANLKNLEEKSLQGGFSAPSGIIEDISREMGCKALHGENAHKATLSLLNMLSSYSWDGKAVLALAAIAVQYGEFCILTQHSTDQLVKSVAMLKSVPAILKPSGSLKLGLVALNNLIKTLLEVARCIVLIEKLSVKYTVKDVPALTTAMARIPVYVYWTVMTVVYCASQITALAIMGEEFQAPELSSFSHIITNIYTNLKKQLDDCYMQIEENKAFQMLLKLHANPTDNVEILKLLIYATDDMQPLVHGSTKGLAKIEDLRRKNVLLFISTVDVSRDDLTIVKQTYMESKKAEKERQFEIVWVPIVEQWTEETQKKYQMLQAEMPWYTVQRPSVLYETSAGRAAIKFIRQEWHFQNKTMVVSLDSQGKVECQNALHMMRIWGSKAFPFTNTREEQLWKEQSWGSGLLLQGIHPKLEAWIKQGKYILVYGGTDLKWVQDFEEKAKAVAADAQLPLEMLNVGKSGKGEREMGIIQSFWSRVESLLFSKIQRHSHDQQDDIMHEIQNMVNYNKSGCWALFCKGSHVLVNGHGSVVLSALWQYDAWKKHVSTKGFDVAFREHVDSIQRADGHKCRHFYFPAKAGKIPEFIKCPDCPRQMEKFVTYQCCHNDDDVTTIC